MIVRGNTVGSTVPRPDYAEGNPERSTFIRNKPDAAIAKAQQTADSAKATAEAALARSGGTMTGPIDMGNRAIVNLCTPASDSHAVNLGYLTAYVSARHMAATVLLQASGWSEAAPYTQTITLEGILATDCPHYGAVYSDGWEAEKEAFALVDTLETGDGMLTFTCFEEKPEVDLTIQLEVNR